MKTIWSTSRAWLETYTGSPRHPGGKSRALELLAQNQYAGPAPVSLEDYVDRIRSQSVRNMGVGPGDVERAFEELVLDHQTLTRLGTALVSGRAIFLHGPTGTGKTTIAETLTKLFHDDLIWLPYAVEVDAQIITVYDSVVHQRVEQTPTPDQDGRWVLCRRPRVMVGGELTIQMLDLQLNSGTKFYSGPVQMKANNGLLIVDDFGRQRVSPEELLNRWVVPLDRRIDFLTLAGGKKIEIPFDIFVVFATNLDPTKLVDEAFLRRIQTKIKVDFVAPEQFREIFRRIALKYNLQGEAGLADELVRMIEKEYKEPLRPCYPRDVIQQVVWRDATSRKTPPWTGSPWPRPAAATSCRDSPGKGGQPLALDTKNFELWGKTRITPNRLAPWVNKDLPKGNGVQGPGSGFPNLQVRVRCGSHGAIQGQPPDHHSHAGNQKRPGAPKECRNLFDFRQILAWLAKERRDVQEQLQWRENIPELMKSLMN